MDGRTAASVLGVAPGASRTEITRAFRAKAKLAHPDAAGSDDAFITLRRAYDLLRSGSPMVAATVAPSATSPWFRTPPTSTVNLTDTPGCRRVPPTRSSAGGQHQQREHTPRDRRGMTFEDHLRSQLAG